MPAQAHAKSIAFDPEMPRLSSELDVIGADDVAAMLKLDRKSVYEGARNGDIPCKRVGRRFIFCRGAITAWLLEAKGATT